MKTFVIVDVGSNHDGEIDRAKKLIDIAIDCGADAVKFQLMGSFKQEWIDPLIKYCGQWIEFMATPFNQAGIDALVGKVKHWKIASTEAADPDFVRAVLKADCGKTVFISDGAVDNPNMFLEKVKVVPLMCVVKYPAKEEDYIFLYKGTWGLSDHTTSITFGADAVARGAVVVEKHFTDDKTRQGDDHTYALGPKELSAYIMLIRETEKKIKTKLTIKDYVGRKIQWPN